MTPGEGLWLVIDLTVLVVMVVILLIVMMVVMLQIKNKISEATDNLQDNVKSVTDRAHGVIDQAEKAVGSVTSKVAMADKIIAGVATAFTGAKAVKTAQRVAKGSGSLAGIVLGGLKIVNNKLRNTADNGKDGQKNG